ncbi:HAMP domain-containing sensor histidine kinase [Paenibacillus faecalis]|uniref:HAMP domain-containing sensor histidine kinase n=1 Tax=Paenibacillus faecalis TaxID=2079532 RepID=UPI000D0EFE30|nr:HAMP domain-containing sensor histidine kinase [Paenibacillus faecalis]
MAKIIRSFRSKMIVLFGASMLVSGSITYLIYKALQFYYHEQVRAEHPLANVRSFIREIGDVNFFLIVFIPLSIFFFFIFTKRYGTYFKEISEGIHHLANGDFGYQVKLSSGDEFGDIARDINLASEKLQTAIKEGEFAESSKDQLVLNLAHDLRTPLTSVLGYLDFILKDEHLPKEQARHYTSIAYTKSQRLEKLIDELFEITRMNYGRLKIEKKPLDLSELLNQLNEELFPLYEKNNLTARLNVDPDLIIEGDGDSLARVFENLLSNAVRYGKDGKFIDINGYKEKDGVVVQVVNYGDCIPPDDLPHIFDMFYKGDKARSNQGESSGLGLFITKNIVEQHLGTVSAESDVIRTLFEVRLPLT